MQDLTRRRILRKLEVLPDDQLYQVLDFIEFLESKYAPGRAARPGGFERFAERVEDGMRARAVGARVMGRTMRALGTAGRVLDGLTSAGRQLLEPAPAPAGGASLERRRLLEREGTGPTPGGPEHRPAPAAGPPADGSADSNDRARTGGSGA